MAASSRAQVLDLYRAMLRESKRFGAYNYRTYAIRRIRDAFRENKNVKDPVEIQALVNKAKRDLGIIRRQVRSEKRERPFAWVPAAPGWCAEASRVRGPGTRLSPSGPWRSHGDVLPETSAEIWVVHARQRSKSVNQTLLSSLFFSPFCCSVYSF
ncbi:LYR motif-containing protein 4 isoform X2 [Bubalus bubalis]|uniref:LYR motif-containing protein 4 isoform X2 n=1 Tax=Bubalus bubalis TaxID=89462 RepID=UPI001D11F3DC|nr:LYR motif-containing protein 4 isoform X2 [Bubalus bubalis]